MSPLILSLRALRTAEGLSRDEHARRSGLARNTMIAWEDQGAVPNIDNFEAALNVLGYTLKITGRRAVAPLREGPVLFTVAGVLRDNGSRRWTSGEIHAAINEQLPDKYTKRQISNACASLVRQGCAIYFDEKYRARQEKDRQ